MSSSAESIATAAPSVCSSAVARANSAARIRLGRPDGAERCHRGGEQRPQLARRPHFSATFVPWLRTKRTDWWSRLSTRESQLRQLAY